MAPKKWYAVRKGHSTGIFNTWDECQAATVGFSGAQYKSFKSEQDARAWLAGSSARAVPATGAPAPAAAYGPTNSRSSRGQSAASAAAGGGKVYAVARGRQVGIFDSWEQAKAVVEGYTNPVFRSFRTRQEAADFLAAHSSSSSRGGGAGTVRGADDSAGAAAKRQRGASYQPPPPPPAFNSQQQQQQGGQAPPAVQLSQHQLVTITFDGGSRNNPGRAGYGYAVFERQRNERVRMGCRPLPYGSTNNEAEYSGLIAGMRYSLEKLGARHIVARGDSQLVVRQMTGQYKVNGERLLPLHREAKLLEQRCESFQIEHIYREENSLADLLSNLAMDSDAAVDQVLLAWQRGASRGELAALLAAGAQVDGDINQVNKLREAPCFMLAVAQLLASLWDNMPVEEVTANLAARGWDEATGGPQVEPLPLPLGTDSPAAAAAAAAEGAGAGTSGVVAAAVAAMQGDGRKSRGQQHGAVRSGRGMQAVPVAPVTLGQDWAREVGRQEALMQQQQQQQRQRRVGDAGGGATVGTLPAQQRTAAAAAASVPCLLVNRSVSNAAASSLAAAPFHRADEAVLLQLQRYRQRRAWPYSSGGGAAAAASVTCIAGGAASSPSSRMHLLHRQLQPPQPQQQHSVFGRVVQHNGSALLRSGSSNSGSIRARAGLAITAAAAAAVRLSRREAAGYNSSNDNSRRQRGMRGLAV